MKQHYKRSARSSSTVAPRIEDSSLAKKAKHLPMFGPGIEISIPLHLLPTYLEMYQLEVLGPKQLGWLREHGIRKRDGVLYVRRTREQSNEQQGKEG